MKRQFILLALGLLLGISGSSCIGVGKEAAEKVAEMFGDAARDLNYFVKNNCSKDRQEKFHNFVADLGEGLMKTVAESAQADFSREHQTFQAQVDIAKMKAETKAKTEHYKETMSSFAKPFLMIKIAWCVW